MYDLISRQAAIDTVVLECGGWIGLARKINKQLKQLPSAQQEIIHCRDCRWRNDQSGSTAWLPCRAIVTPSDFYCGRAERIADAPTIEERKKGKWIRMSDADGDYYCCDQCGEELPRYMTVIPSWDRPYPHKQSIDKTNFCLNCGSDMREGDQDDPD